MLMKPLISAIFLSVALTSNGAGSWAATGRQELHQIPAGPSAPEPPSAVCEPGESGEELREEFHQTYALSSSGRVSLENINGDVQIKVWDRAAVQVDAVKRAYRKDRLTEARIEVDATEENVRIKTEYPDGPQNFSSGNRRYDNPATVDYTLTVPRKAMLESVELVNGSIDIDGIEGNVKASSINGRLNARGLLGEARLSTINGPLNASFNQLDASKTISLGSVNGNVTLVIPSNANATVRAGTVHGGISTDFGLKVNHGEYVGHSMDGQLGAGGPRIKLDNVNGAIKLTHAQDGLPMSPAASAKIEASDADNDVDVDVDVDVNVNENARARVDAARVARDVRRQVDQAMRESQKEIERAQREIEREQREIARAQRIATVTRVRTSEVYNPRFTAKETKTFAVSGSPSVTLNTFDGQVTVHGWDKAEVAYTATKTANDEGTLKEISIQSQQQGEAVSITATNNEQHDGSVNFDVYVPRQSTLHVSSGDGALNLEGVKGQITLRSGDGPIEVSNGGGQLQVNTGDGLIKVIRFEGQVDARTGDGAIALDGNFNAVSARTGDGTISLSVPAGSSFTIETNAPDEINNEGFIVAEDITPSPRVKRWKIGNGGKVFVLKTGEGKILLRPRQ